MVAQGFTPCAGGRPAPSLEMCTRFRVSTPESPTPVQAESEPSVSCVGKRQLQGRGRVWWEVTCLGGILPHPYPDSSLLGNGSGNG